MIITITNQKGGVGKTTTTAALTFGLTGKRSRALMIDADPQSNLTYITNAPTDSPTIADVLDGRASAREAIRHTEQGDIITGSQRLAEDNFIPRGTRRYQYRLADALEPLRQEYEYIIIDTPPALGIVTINALTASDGVIITARADALSLQGIGQLDDTITTVREHLNNRLEVLGVLVTQYNERIVVNRLAIDKLIDAAGGMGSRVFSTRIRESAAVREAQILQVGLFQHAPKSNAAKDYKAFTAEIKKRGANK